jgi:hypothetical protein
MTFTTCERCGDIARIFAGGISRLDANCLTDVYRCDACGTLTWRDRVHQFGRNFTEQIIANPVPLHLDQQARALAHV